MVSSTRGINGRSRDSAARRGHGRTPFRRSPSWPTLLGAGVCTHATVSLISGALIVTGFMVAHALFAT